MSKHTPEPWATVVSPLAPYIQIIDAERRSIGKLTFNTANADRVIMAVNAMSGIASAAPGSVAKLVEAADKAKEQLAYMLSQQHEGSEFYAGCGSECHTRVTELLAALAAITVEGGE